MNQALVAVFGGAGRWLAALVGVLAVATGVVSTVPGVLSEVAALLPTAPAYNGMLAALTEAERPRRGVAGLLIWSLLAFAARIVAATTLAAGAAPPPWLAPSRARPSLAASSAAGERQPSHEARQRPPVTFGWSTTRRVQRTGLGDCGRRVGRREPAGARRRTSARPRPNR